MWIIIHDYEVHSCMVCLLLPKPKSDFTLPGSSSYTREPPLSYPSRTIYLTAIHTWIAPSIGRKLTDMPMWRDPVSQGNQHLSS